MTNRASRGVAEALIDWFTKRGVPRHIRSDSGPEFIARTVRRLADLTGVETPYFALASPRDNGYSESFHSRLRDEPLNAEAFADVREARDPVGIRPNKNGPGRRYDRARLQVVTTSE